ncbi:MAG: Rieske 2Fe-2S domain-containing protein [Deltaproteobacteria bacterium]|nr:Rieske 2Fe-2S domain-containing protein [Deltaproteobacteria bacterium]
MGSAQEPTLWTRRNTVTRIAWGLFVGSLGGTMVACVRALFPRVEARPPSTVVLGRPNEFSIGEVSERWKKSHGLILVRSSTGFYALRSVCTHLGCVPGWQPAQDKFKCFCHGSGFRVDGTNFEGPAPRPLERLAINLDEAGRIVVDTAIRFRGENGEWTAKEAFLSYARTS